MIVLDRIGSTSAWLRDRAREGAPHGTAVRAREQTAGRGRLGRSWLAAPDDAVLLSVLVRRDLPAPRAPLLALATAVAVSEVVPGLGIKWPNDLLAPDGRKVAGILLEAEFAAGRLDHAVIGIGLNVHGHPDLPTATSLDDAFPGRPHDVDGLAQALTTAVLAEADALVSRPEVVLDRWRRRAVTLGRRVAVGEVEGLAVDLDPDGALVVETATGRVRVVAGDVALIS